MTKKEKKKKKSNLFNRIFRFFIPKNFSAELHKGMMKGEQMRQGKVSAKSSPTWWLGKIIRKMIDPKHRIKIGNQKEKK